METLTDTYIARYSMRLYTPAQLSEELHVSERVLRSWRSRKYGPMPIRVGRVIRYPEISVKAFIDWQFNEAKDGWFE